MSADELVEVNASVLVSKHSKEVHSKQIRLSIPHIHTGLYTKVKQII